MVFWKKMLMSLMIIFTSVLFCGHSSLHLSCAPKLIPASHWHSTGCSYSPHCSRDARQGEECYLFVCSFLSSRISSWTRNLQRISANLEYIFPATLIGLMTYHGSSKWYSTGAKQPSWVNSLTRSTSQRIINESGISGNSWNMDDTKFQYWGDIDANATYGTIPVALYDRWQNFWAFVISTFRDFSAIVSW